jgi:hypothetical protein
VKHVALALALCACAGEAEAPALPSFDRLGALRSDGRIRGEIAGRSFTLRDARFRIVQGPNRTRVDLLFSDRRIEHCGLPIDRPRHTFVWARVADRTTLAPERLEQRGDDDDPIELHYERPRAGELVTSHRAVASVEIERVDAQAIAGQLRACFADVHESCVAGTFEARPCVSRIDGQAIREPPGLEDGVLDAVGGGR